jgi:hypothetical protein
MEILVTAGEFENYARIREHDRLVQRRIDLPSPLATEVHIDTVGDGSGCAVLQVCHYISVFNYLFLLLPTYRNMTYLSSQATLRYNVRTPPPS